MQRVPLKEKEGGGEEKRGKKHTNRARRERQPRTLDMRFNECWVVVVFATWPKKPSYAQEACEVSAMKNCCQTRFGINYPGGGCNVYTSSPKPEQLKSTSAAGAAPRVTNALPRHRGGGRYFCPFQWFQVGGVPWRLCCSYCSCVHGT